MNRIAITGLGCISAVGNTVGEFLSALQAGRSGIGPIHSFDTVNHRIKIAAECKLDESLVDEKYRKVDPYVRHGAMAANEAVQDAGLTQNDYLPHRAAVVFATGIGGQNTMESALRKVHIDDARRLHPMTVPKLIPSTAAAQISIDHGIQGPAFTTTSACSSAGNAIATAVLMLRAGLVDVAIVGGSESLIEPGCLRAWEALRVLAPDTCRPFSSNRQGMVLGEAAAAIVLERCDFAKQRGANIYAELAGIGMSSDAEHMLRPTAQGPVMAMQNALKDAKINPDEVQYINAHGTGTAINDETESLAIETVFNGAAQKLSISSTKPIHGHAMGAGSAIELIAAIQCMQHGFIAPTLNYIGQDPKCLLDYTPNEARRREVSVALSNSFAFGGLNVSVALKQMA